MILSEATTSCQNIYNVKKTGGMPKQVGIGRKHSLPAARKSFSIYPMSFLLPAQQLMLFAQQLVLPVWQLVLLAQQHKIPGQGKIFNYRSRFNFRGLRHQAKSLYALPSFCQPGLTICRKSQFGTFFVTEEGRKFNPQINKLK